MDECARVIVVDDDQESREQIVGLARNAGFQAAWYPSFDRLLEDDPPCWGCAVMCWRVLAEKRGKAHAKLQAQGFLIPIICLVNESVGMSALREHDDRLMAVLEKPVRAIEFVCLLLRAVKQSRHAYEQRQQSGELVQRVRSLTSREREVLDAVLAGNTTREIALTLHRSVKTIELHRTHILRKLGMRNAIDLVREITKLSEQGSLRK